jgi:hypothetical protein
VQTYLMEQIQEEKVLSRQEAQKHPRFEINPSTSLRGGEEWEKGERRTWRSARMTDERAETAKQAGFTSSRDNGEGTVRLQREEGRRCHRRGGGRLSALGETKRKAQVGGFPPQPFQRTERTTRPRPGENGPCYSSKFQHRILGLASVMTYMGWFYWAVHFAGGCSFFLSNGFTAAVSI